MTSEFAANPTHLLLVDDDRLILATLSRGLQDVGYRVSCAESAEEAQEMLTSGLRPDLALLDVRLPGVALADLRDAAIELKLGGVGFYPRENFVHIDTGRVRTW